MSYLALAKKILNSEGELRQKETAPQPSAAVRCRDCQSAEVGNGWALCRETPWDGIPGQVPDHPHPCPNFTPREKPVSPPERILSCAECPWYQLNPWSHYPELPAWCHYNMDHLVIDNPQCIGYRRGEVPERREGRNP